MSVVVELTPLQARALLRTAEIGREAIRAVYGAAPTDSSAQTVALGVLAHAIEQGERPLSGRVSR